MGRGVDKNSLPNTWEDVTYFIKKWITYEGRFVIICNYYFQFLAHLLSRKLVNIRYLLLKSLHHLEVVVQCARYPGTCVTNHRFMKLIIIGSLEYQESTWIILLVTTRGPSREDVEANSKEKNEGVVTEEVGPSRKRNSLTNKLGQNPHDDIPDETNLASSPTIYSHVEEDLHTEMPVDVTSGKLEN